MSVDSRVVRRSPSVLWTRFVGRAREIAELNAILEPRGLSRSAAWAGPGRPAW